MPRKRLTEKVIDDVAPRPGKQFTVWDTDLKGFGVRVSPAGTKTFVFCYRTPAGRMRWKTLGRAGTVTLDQARRLAKVDAGTVAARQDPLQPTDQARDGFTVKVVSEKWIAALELAKRKPMTLRNYRQVLDAYILPKLGSIPIADITTADAVRVHETLRKTPTQANRVLAALSALLGWSMKEKGKGFRYRPQGPNPCLGIEKNDEHKRKRYLEPTEYARVGKALRTSTLSPGIRAAIELLILTGARPVEIASLQWAHVKLTQNALELLDSKTGAKTIHLSPAAVKVLKRWPHHLGSPYVFPGTGRKDKGLHLHPSTLTHAWADLRETIGLEDTRLYDLRHSYASIAMSEHGLSLPQIGAQLGHSQPQTTARYSHMHARIAKRHAAQIGGSIAAALRKRVKA